MVEAKSTYSELTQTNLCLVKLEAFLVTIFCSRRYFYRPIVILFFCKTFTAALISVGTAETAWAKLVGVGFLRVGAALVLSCEELS